MTRLLKYDANFTACSTESGDELFPNGIFELNITKMLKYIRANPVCVNLEVVAVGDFLRGFTTINGSHVDSVDISQQHIGFLTSKKAYLVYIDYWNGKLKKLHKYYG